MSSDVAYLESNHFIGFMIISNFREISS